MLSYIKDTLYHTLSISPFSKEVYIENYKVTKYSTPLLVAELGLNHNGSLELAMEMITVAHEAGINAIKLQSYTTETFINKDIEEAKELFNTFKKYELSYEEHQAIARFCKEKNIIFLSTPLSLEWVDKLEALGIAAYKIASGDINNFQLLHKLCSQKKPIIISTGAASIKEIKRSRNFFIKHNKKNVIYLHCTSIYPTPLYKANLRNISYLQSHITPLVGFSDHTESYEAASHATTLGAVLIEKHFTLDKNLTGPDHAFSSTPKEILLLKEHIKKATLLRGQLYKVIYPEEKKSALLGKRSLYKIDNKLLALRPRLKGLPKDSDFKVS